MTNTEAIFHLALLGMYADNSLTLTEDKRIDHLLTELGWRDDTGVRAAFVAKAYDKVRSVNVSDEAVAEFLTKVLKPALSAPGEKERALQILDQIINVDGQVSSTENNLAGLAKWML